VGDRSINKCLVSIESLLYVAHQSNSLTPIADRIREVGDPGVAAHIYIEASNETLLIHLLKRHVQCVVGNPVLSTILK
jgi:hypothetical protein